ncbi:MAG: FtsX-like permease family protein [Saccharofermentans sp.]|nr:FtsX-like permease family protein [Saccharofermentans sp.]
MNIVLKNSLKNIIGKPFRTLLVTFTIFMCCLSALLSFDAGSLIPRILESFYGNMARADIMAYADGRDLTELPEGFPECDRLNISSNGEILHKDIDGEYAYVTTESLGIYGIDIQGAVDMEFLDPIELKEGEVYISYDLSEEFGYDIGDTLPVHDRAGEDVELTVVGIFPKDIKNSLLSGYSAVVNEETGDILSCGRRTADIVLIDIKDDSLIEEGKDLLKTQHPGINIADMFINETLMNVIMEFELVFYLLFAATVLLVIFVTSSICNRIVSERMSYIGTLRSLGMSAGRTAGILLLENVLYAIIGAVPATIIYTVLRNIVCDNFFNSETGFATLGFKIPSVSKVLIAGVIIFAIVMECLIPLRAILKALKTSIRDIIFDNRDTAYRFGRPSLIFGIIFAVIAVICVIFNSNMATAIICLLSSIGALALLFPRILKLVTLCIRKICNKTGNAAWDLAAVEAVSRKSTVGSGVLCATASAMCIVVVEIANLLFGITPGIPYNCDVVAECNEMMKYYSYVEDMEGVTDVEAIYYSAIYLKIDGSETSNLAFVYSLPDGGYKYYTEFEGLPESIPHDGIVLDTKYAKRNGIEVGDKVTFSLGLNSDDIIPVVHEFTVTDVVDGISDAGIETVIINHNDYIAFYQDRPKELLICAPDPDGITDTLKTYGKNSFASVNTATELERENDVQSAAVNAVIDLVIVIAIGMTAIGVISNLLIGFEGRKKECAVLLSTSMNKGKLSSILLREVFITAVTASSIGVVLGTFLLTIIADAFQNSEIFAMDVSVDYKRSLIFFVVLTLVFTGTVLFPIKNLKKMKISEQIKYE